MGTGATVDRMTLVFRLLSEQGMRAAGEFNDLLRSPKLKATADGVGESARTANSETCEVKGSLEVGQENLRQTGGGGADAPKADLVVYIHRRDLERVGLMVNEKPLIQVNDQLLRAKRGTKVEWEAPDNPGMYVVEVDLIGGGPRLYKFSLMQRPERV